MEIVNGPSQPVMDEKYIASMLLTNQQVLKAVADKHIALLEKSGKGKDLLEHIASRAKSRKIKTPTVYIDNTGVFTGPKPNAGASLTKEGAVLMFVNDAFLAMPKNMQNALIDHELTHVGKGHITPKFIAASRSKPELLLKVENEADKEAVCSSSDRKETAKSLLAVVELFHKLETKSYVAKYPGTPFERAKDIVGKMVRSSTHPPYFQRIDDIKSYPEKCDSSLPS